MFLFSTSQQDKIDREKVEPLTKDEKKIQKKLKAKRKKFGFEGSLFIIGLDGYDDARLQYASTSCVATDMRPGMILYATGDDDVKAALKVCRERNMKMAIRTGGHQYCGYSSTSPGNMQVDLSKAYPQYQYNKETNTLICGPSHALGDWALSNHENGIYLPMGMCWNVHLGGHVHTGGWGMVARSHGILADHVKAFDIILANGEKHRVVKPGGEEKTNDLNDDLYYATLGGSIGGNFGIVTQFEFTPIRDADHPNSACYMFFWFKTEENTRQILDLIQKYTKMCGDGEIPSDYEFMLTITGAGRMHMLPTRMQEEISRLKHLDKNIFGHVFMPGLIQIWMCYTNKGGASVEFDDQWFEGFVKEVGAPVLAVRNKKKPVSYGLAHMFIMTAEREMEYPYIKRDRVSTKLPDNFAEEYSRRMEIISGGFGTKNGCHLVSQLQIYAGGAVLSNEADSYSSYSWRDQVLMMSHDAFYDYNKHGNANDHALLWQEENDTVFCGEGGAFAEKDMRMFAYTWGKRTLDTQWRFYYDSEEKYNRLRRIKAEVDPDEIFNPNEFCVTGLKE